MKRSYDSKIAELFGISTTFSEEVEIGTHVLDEAPHDGTGNGYITIGATYSFTYYEQGLQYECGRKENVSYHVVRGTNVSSKVIDVKDCIHE